MAEFAYHRGLTPLMAMLLAIATVELLVVHLLMLQWSGRAAWAMSAVSLAGLVWILLSIRSLKALPVVVGARAVTFRAGRLMRLDVPVENVSGIRRDWTGGDLKQAGVLKMSLLAYPNILVDLATPQPFVRAGRRRNITAVAHRFDDPVGFSVALTRAVAMAGKGATRD